jgi:hypothetical protein
MDVDLDGNSGYNSEGLPVFDKKRDIVQLMLGIKEA